MLSTDYYGETKIDVAPGLVGEKIKRNFWARKLRRNREGTERGRLEEKSHRRKEEKRQEKGIKESPEWPFATSSPVLCTR